ncbi:MULTISPECIES: ABC transporter permease [Parabacteroides]|uniref:ABC transporter permease n=1 Tax=Parabacteroides provencensis TaxID=1944636 RepID=UPI000C149BC3|nr:ABC transporter permease [Parabacteroides provencensis]
MNNLLNLKAFAKFLSRNKAYTAIDIFGLSVSLMFVLLIAVYTVQELSVDSFQTKADRIYVLGNENMPVSAPGIAYQLKNRYPEIEKVCPVMAGAWDGLTMKWKDKKMKADLLFADSTFFDLFDFQLISGSPSQVLSARNYAVVSESFARKLFGEQDPTGKSLLVGDTISVVVSGVVKDMVHSALPAADIIIRWEQIQKMNPSLTPDALNNAGSITIFVLAQKGSNFQSRTTDIHDWFKTFFWIYERDVWKEVRLEPLKTFYFSGWGGGWPLHTGDWKFVMVLMSVGILILIFAVINYINLTVAQAGFRAKEMATRRLLGSSRGELFFRLMLEATLLTFISLLIGILLAFAAIPFVNDLLNTHIDLSVLFTWPWIVSILALTLSVGVLSGLLPALVISSAKPIEVVRGTFRAKTKMVFSKFFITFENVITITMIAVSILMIMQIKHMLDAPLGFKTTNVLVSGSIWDDTQLNAFVNELRSLPGVKQVGKTRGVPVYGGSNNWTATYDGRNFSFQQFIMDKECFDILGLEIVRDNQVANSNFGFYLSEQTVRDMNLPADAQSFVLNDGDPISLYGIIKEFHIYNISMENKPIMFRFLKKDEMPWQIVVETIGNPFVAYKEVAAAYEKVTGLEYEGVFMDQELREQHASQIRMVKIISVFAIIAILISLLGLIAMSTYFIQQRSKEVAVRKVFGSTNKEILIKLVRTFMIYVGIAFVIAVPIIYHFGNDWLSNYSYRIALNPLVFIVAGLFCFVISFAAVFVQSWRAANTDPVESFRHVQQ